MPETPDVSIITPTYNSARFIDDTIGSVLAQTFTNWEMIIVDDGSTDGTVERIKEWADRDARIILLQNASKMGPGPAAARVMAEGPEGLWSGERDPAGARQISRPLRVHCRLRSRPDGH